MEDDELTPLDRIIIAFSSGKDPDPEDTKTMTAKKLAELKSEIENAQSNGFSVEIPF